MTKLVKAGIIIAAALVFTALVALGSGLVFAQDADQPTNHESVTAASLGTGFSFQGKLEKDDTALDDLCDMQFSLWDADIDGAQIGATQVFSDVLVSEGLFTIQLNESGEFGSAAFRGEARWLEIGVKCADGEADYTNLSPRQALTAAPYAHGLRPGAYILAETGTALTVETAATNVSSLVVNGHSPSASSPSLRVNNDGSGGYGFDVNKTNGPGVASFGRNNGATGSGVAGYSNNWYGVYGYTDTSSNNYGFYSPDNLYTRNINMPGAMMMVVQNSSAGTMESGDVASFAGINIGEATDGLPIVQVAPANAENIQGVAGVVYGKFPDELLNAPPEGLEDPSLSQYDPTAPAAPGDYLLLVVYGPAQVKTNGGRVAIQPGDAITLDGKLAVTAATTPGSGVFGKALEASADDKALIYVFVTLR